MILTYGYQGRQQPAFFKLVADLQATVIDVRARPYSRAAAWNQRKLESALGLRYRWEGARLGGLLPGVVSPLHGVAYDGKKPWEYEWKFDPAALQWLDDNADPDKPWLILLCACHSAIDCHRHQLARALLARGVEVTHISDELAFDASECERMVQYIDKLPESELEGAELDPPMQVMNLVDLVTWRKELLAK